MKWYRPIMVGEQAKRRRYRIIGKIKRNLFQKDIYVVTLAFNQQDLLDIYPAWILLQPYFIRKDFMIVGIAKGYQEALQVITQLVMEVYQKTGDVKLREYLEEGQSRQNRQNRKKYFNNVKQ